MRSLVSWQTAAVVLLAVSACACGSSRTNTAALASPATTLTPAPAAAAPATTAPAPSSQPAPAPAPAPAPSPSSSLPTPPANAVVISHMEDSTSNWNQCSDCAGGLNNTTDYWMSTFQSSPSMDGSSREFYVGGPAWTAALFYHPVQSYRGQYNYATHFLWDFWVYADSTSMQYIWDFEYDLYQALNGYEYMMGTHCVFGSTQTGRYWEIYSQADHQWKATTVPCSRNTFTAGKWHHIQWMLERIPNSTRYQYDTLVVDGTAYSLNISQYAAASSWGDTLGVQWQIDTNSIGGSVHEWLDNATLTIW